MSPDTLVPPLPTPFSRKAAGLLFVLLLLEGSACAASASDTPIPGRIAALSGGVMVRGEGDQGWSYADPNISVFQGDAIWTEPDATAVIDLPDRTRVRLAPQTHVQVGQTARPARIELPTGSLFACSQMDLRPALEVATPGARIVLYGWSAMRVDVDEKGSTRASLVHGTATVEAQGGKEAMQSGQRVYADVGSLPSRPVHWDPRSTEDDFDVWNLDGCPEREPAPPPTAYSEPPAENAPIVERVYVERYVTEYRTLVGFDDLWGYGSWIWIGGRACWRPWVTVGWYPFSRGYWAWGRWGWTWVAYEPWGWVTHHHGSWNWAPGWGWVWYPGTPWHPGHVYWWGCGGRVCWTPYDPWGKPCHAGGPRWHVGTGVDVDVHISSAAEFTSATNRVIRPKPDSHWREGVVATPGEPIRDPRVTLRPRDPRRTDRLVSREGRPADDRVRDLEERLSSPRIAPGREATPPQGHRGTEPRRSEPGDPSRESRYRAPALVAPVRGGVRTAHPGDPGGAHTGNEARSEAAARPAERTGLPRTGPAATVRPGYTTGRIREAPAVAPLVPPDSTGSRSTSPAGVSAPTSSRGDTSVSRPAPPPTRSAPPRNRDAPPPRSEAPAPRGPSATRPPAAPEASPQARPSTPASPAPSSPRAQPSTPSAPAAPAAPSSPSGASGSAEGGSGEKRESRQSRGR